MMQNVTQEEFEKKLVAFEEFDDELFNFGKNNIVFPLNLAKNIRFTNCSFTGNTLKIENINLPDRGICFTDCVFKCKVEISNSTLDRIWFLETKEIEDFLMCRSKAANHYINSFNFSYTDKESSELNNNFKFKNYIFAESFVFENVHMFDGEITFDNNIFGNADNNEPFKEIIFKNSKLVNVLFEKNKFNVRTSFFKTSFSYRPEALKKRHFKFNCFAENTFEYVDFSNSSFQENFGLWECIFNNTTSFHNIRNSSNTNFKVFQCQFNKYTSFDNAKIFNFHLYRSIFNDITSFQSTRFTQLEIDKTVFEKRSFFDDVKISNLKTCKRKTLRLIKQELQKADNKIDYNRFRSYELAAYYRELKWCGNFKDKVILGATWLVTGFDHSWRRALVFTLSAGLLLYTLFFISENYMLNVSISNWKEFLSGYFRFLLVTDFYNPTSEGRTYIDNTNTLGWIIFILGKIVIAFGIYEMIQAFRKFKA